MANKCIGHLVFHCDDNDTMLSFHCSLQKGHEGPHCMSEIVYDNQPYTMMWLDVYYPDTVDLIDSYQKKAQAAIMAGRKAEIDGRRAVREAVKAAMYNELEKP